MLKDPKIATFHPKIPQDPPPKSRTFALKCPESPKFRRSVEIRSQMNGPQNPEDSPQNLAGPQSIEMRPKILQFSPQNAEDPPRNFADAPQKCWGSLKSSEFTPKCWKTPRNSKDTPQKYRGSPKSSEFTPKTPRKNPKIPQIYPNLRSTPKILRIHPKIEAARES